MYLYLVAADLSRVPFTSGCPQNDDLLYTVVAACSRYVAQTMESMGSYQDKCWYVLTSNPLSQTLKPELNNYAWHF